MKVFSVVCAVVALVLLALLWRQESLVDRQSASLDALLQDRDALRAELQRVSRRLDQVQESAAKSPPAQSQAPAAAVVSAPKLPTPRPGVTMQAPAGWHRNGRNPDKYVVGVDTVETWGGMPSAYVESVAEDMKESFGGMMQTTAASEYAGKRVRMNAWIKTQEANDGGGRIWMRIDGQERGQTLGFDNMNNRPMKGTNDWQEVSVVLDVPVGASALAYGFFVQGGGKMWVSGQTLTPVGPEVPTTNMLPAAAALPTVPRNLGFDPKSTP